jgi:starvation-inducible DNA-binding protein
MTTTSEPVPDTARLTAAALLQDLLPELLALSLEAKHARWNLTGRGFLALHDLIGRIAVDTWTWADRVAERTAALGFRVDARPTTVAAVAGHFPAGRLVDPPAASGTAWPSAVAELGARIEHVAGSAGAGLGRLAMDDAVAHDVVVAAVEGLERYCWMLRAQAA